MFLDVTNVSDDENPAVTKELLRLKNLFETHIAKVFRDTSISVIS